MALNGAKVLLIVNSGTVDNPVWTEVGQQTELTSESKSNLIDVTSKDDDHKKFIYGTTDDTVKLTSLYVPDDAAMQAIRNAKKNKATVILRRTLDGTAVEEAEALIETISDSWPNDDSSETEISFQLNEEWHEITP